MCSIDIHQGGIYGMFFFHVFSVYFAMYIPMPIFSIFSMYPVSHVFVAKISPINSRGDGLRKFDMDFLKPSLAPRQQMGEFASSFCGQHIVYRLPPHIAIVKLIYHPYIYMFILIYLDIYIMTIK